MAEMKIIVQEIDKIESHDNADRLAIAFTNTFDWPIIVGKDSFKPGDEVIHFPVDCVVDDKMEEILLGGSKIKLSKGRIRAAKIRGIVSYGILCPLSKLKEHFNVANWEGDLMKSLGCHKYEPPVKGSGSSQTGQKTKKRQNRNFTKYFNMNHLQNCKGIFKAIDFVSATEKLHGTSFRAGYVRRDVSGFFAKILHRVRKIFDGNADFEFVYGSRNVQLQNNKYDKSVYKQMVERYSLRDLPNDMVVYGEIVGEGIQKGYRYTDKKSLFIYDIKQEGVYLSVAAKNYFCNNQCLSMVPSVILSYCEFKNIDFEKIWKVGSIWPDEVIEGVVIETLKEEVSKFGRKKVKILNPAYLLNKENTDFH